MTSSQPPRRLWLALITGAAFLLGVTGLLGGLVFYGMRVWQAPGIDFLVYLKAANRFENHYWRAIYDWQTDGANPYRYSPIFLPWLEFLARFPEGHAALAWFFTQTTSYALGFYFIYLLFKKNMSQPRAISITFLLILFVYRFILDSLSVGQITGTMFLFLSLFFYLKDRKTLHTLLAGAALAVPSLLKIGPALLFLLAWPTQPLRSRGFFSTALLSRGRLLAGAATGTSILAVISLVRVGDFSDWVSLWKDWIHVVASDSIYFDASHYGSQSLKSFLLRAAREESIGKEWVVPIWLGASLFLLGALTYLSFLRKPRHLSGRGAAPGDLLLSLGILTYLWLMPETFKYGYVFLAFPIGFLIQDLFGNSSTRGVIHKIALLLGFLLLSLPGLDVVGEPLFYDIQKLSVPFMYTVFLGIVIASRLIGLTQPMRWKSRTLPPWDQAPQRYGDLDLSILIPIAPGEPQSRAALDTVMRFLSDRSIPSETLEVSLKGGVAQSWREGFLRSRGKYLLALDLPEKIDPFELEVFLKGAWGAVELKQDWIHARGSDAYFLMSRRLAQRAFAHQTTPERDFLREVEWTAEGYGMGQVPVEVSKKPASMRASPHLWLRRRTYRPLPELAAVSADDWGFTQATNEGILELARLGIVKRVSCFSHGAAVTHRLEELRSITGIQIGLHFNLTYGKHAFRNDGKTNAGPFYLRWCLTWGRNKSNLIQEVRRSLLEQIEQLERLGIAPKYMDGHHHVHILPGMIAAIADILEKKGISEVRLPYSWQMWAGPKMLLNLWSLMAYREMRRRGFRSRRFYYPSLKTFLRPWRLRQSLEKNAAREIIVHPASEDDFHSLSMADSYTSERVTEFRALRMMGYMQPEGLRSTASESDPLEAFRAPSSRALPSSID